MERFNQKLEIAAWLIHDINTQISIGTASSATEVVDTATADDEEDPDSVTFAAASAASLLKGNW